MKSQRHFSAACGYVVVPTKLIDAAPSAAAILVYQVIQRMCLEAEGECKSPIKLIARDAKVGVKPTKLSLYWLENEGWIQINRIEGCAYSYLAFTQQVNQ
jgi:hypothetical protein